jgi:arabinofuranosyltransferase
MEYSLPAEKRSKMAPTWSRSRCFAVVALAAIVFVVHAHSIDAICDDAFISLRYARNLVDHGVAEYNLGERVEGYSSPLWMLLSTVPLALGVSAFKALSILGYVGGVALIAAVWRLWTTVAPTRPTAGFVVLGLVALSTPLAAWSSSGLETPAFAALVALSVAETATLAGNPTRKRAFRAGAVLGLTYMFRPEGALIGAAAVAYLLFSPERRRQLGRFALAAAIPMAVLLFWRLAYYGELVPNTFFAKLSAPLATRIDLGLHYAVFTASELGFVFSLVLVGSALVAPGKSHATRIIRLVVPVFVAYVISVGGDFFDLFRFFVPVLPLLYVTLVALALDLESRFAITARGRALLVSLAVPVYLLNQISLRGRALQVDDPVRADAGIEPLGWTKQYALTWADSGRFLHEHARPGDTMADAAAGAAPYFAGLPNLDLFGLNDPEIAKRGLLLPGRPGHQRLATLNYVLSRRPTFLMVPNCVWPWSGNWVDYGYRCAEASAPSSVGGATELSFLVEASRGNELAAKGALRLRSN